MDRTLGRLECALDHVNPSCMSSWVRRPGTFPQVDLVAGLAPRSRAEVGVRRVSAHRRTGPLRGGEVARTNADDAVLMLDDVFALRDSRSMPVSRPRSLHGLCRCGVVVPWFRAGDLGTKVWIPGTGAVACGACRLPGGRGSHPLLMEGHSINGSRLA
jgi:hypothetical protein